MPAAAVIPAPIAYIKVVAVKKLVVGFLGRAARSALRGCALVRSGLSSGDALLALTGWDAESATVTLKKLECLKQAYALNTLAWNNRIGLWFYFVGF